MRKRGIAVAAGVVLVLVVSGVFGVCWWAAGQQIVPNHGTHSDTVLAVKDGSVVLTANSSAARRRGTYWLSWDGGSALMGDVLAQGPDRVERPLLRGSRPTTGTAVYVGGAMPSDPKTTLGLDYSEVMVPTELGLAPAWFIPAAKDTWVIAVHGQNGRRKALMPIAPVFNRLGLPVLAITYRNDEGAPASPDGLLHLGGDEWRDVESAVRYAQEKGARRVVLYGASNGGQIVGQFLSHSPLANATVATMLDAPTTSLPLVGDFAGEQHGAPSVMTWLVHQIMQWRTDTDLDRLDLIKYPPAVKPPTLLIQGDADTQCSVQMNRGFFDTATKSGWRMQYAEFPGAEHTESWNSDPARYEKLVHDFLRLAVDQ